MHLNHSQSLTSTCSSAYRNAPTSANPQVSTYHSLKLELQICSSSVKVQNSQQPNSVGGNLVPVFSEYNKIEGKITLDPSCHHSGSISITVEGVLHYHIGKEDPAMKTGLGEAQLNGKHVFLSSSTMITVSPASTSARPGLAFRMRRRPSFLSLNGPAPLTERSHPFSISLPCSTRPGEGLPSTLALGPKKESSDFEISYKIVATWQPYDTSFDSMSRLEIPIHFQHEDEFQLHEFATARPWLELPLISDHPVSFRCAVTLPTPVTFKRGSSIPYFVVFTTKPGTADLAREIATDATVSVSLLRKLTTTKQVRLPPSPPETPAGAGYESDVTKGKSLRRPRSSRQLLSKTSPTSLQGSGPNSLGRDRSLPRLPTQVVFNDTKTLKSDVCIGFPKRPRYPRDPHIHPILEEKDALPDGLFRSKILLKGDLLPSIDVEGLNVKYYLDVSVLFGQDDLCAQIPVRVV